MENYNDELLPDNFQQIAKAYSKTLKNKGFVFVKLEEEEFDLLLAEIFVLIEKMHACLKKLHRQIDSAVLQKKLDFSRKMLEDKFCKKEPHAFEYVDSESSAFFCLTAVENTLNIKLMLLSVKSGEIELCNQVITCISGVFAQSFSCEGFRVLN